MELRFKVKKSEVFFIWIGFFPLCFKIIKSMKTISIILTIVHAPLPGDLSGCLACNCRHRIQWQKPLQLLFFGDEDNNGNDKLIKKLMFCFKKNRNCTTSYFDESCELVVVLHRPLLFHVYYLIRSDWRLHQMLLINTSMLWFSYRVNQTFAVERYLDQTKYWVHHN